MVYLAKNAFQMIVFAPIVTNGCGSKTNVVLTRSALSGEVLCSTHTTTPCSMEYRLN